MFDAHLHQVQPSLQISDTLFAWRGGQVVLLGERTDEYWVLARGWPERDRLADVRRWYFSTPSAFAAQVLRLVREATGNVAESERARSAAITWAADPELTASR